MHSNASSFIMCRFSCNRGYRLVGQHRVYCTRRGWNLNTPPVCASKKNKTIIKLQSPVKSINNISNTTHAVDIPIN